MLGVIQFLIINPYLTILVLYQCHSVSKILNILTIPHMPLLVMPVAIPQYTRQITGGPLASMMTIEKPETFNEVVCVAPAEGQTPLFIMTDPNFEAMSNPEKFPISSGCFTTERPNKITYRKYFNQRLLNVDGRFAKDTDYLFVAQCIVEAKPILDDAHNFIWRQKPGRNLTAQQARDKNIVSQCVRKDKAYSFMKNLRGSPAYYQKTFYELC